jgi:hypothetical protein
VKLQRIGAVPAALLYGLAAACGGGNGTSAPPAPPAGTLHVAGTYTIVRSYVSNTCDPEIPGTTATVTGTVTHAQGGSQFTLANSDGGNFNARIETDGTFTSGVQSRIGVNGESYDLLFAGRFSLQGFHATVAVDLFRAGGACRSVLDWEATKQGAPNVIP